MHNKRCEMAKGDICKCSCGGRFHGIRIQANEDNGLWDFILTEKEAKPFREQFHKREICFCGEKVWHHPIVGYWDHPQGWIIRNRLAWLFIHCPNCGYDWSIWKLGASRIQLALDDFIEVKTS